MNRYTATFWLCKKNGANRISDTVMKVETFTFQATDIMSALTQTDLISVSLLNRTPKGQYWKRHGAIVKVS